MESPSSNGTALNREAFLAAKGARKRERVEIPELGGHVYVQELTAGERDDYEASITIGNPPNFEIDPRNLRAKLLGRTLVDENGNRIFGDADLDAISCLPSSIAGELFDRSQRLSKMDQQSIDEMAGNSNGVRTKLSGRASR